MHEVCEAPGNAAHIFCEIWRTSGREKEKGGGGGRERGISTAVAHRESSHVKSSHVKF